jgi:RNA polymerase sigma-70 factor (ECF subfamily)
MDAVGQLPLEFREVIVLREFEELSYRDIALLLDLPIGTVMSRLARARRRLQKSLCKQVTLSLPTTIDLTACTQHAVN